MDFPVRPGDVIAERYRVERLLGEGGMGVVVEAQHLMLGERVAVKFLLPAALQIPDVLARFQREARAASRVQSEHVTRVMDVGVLSGGQPYIVMEYLEGRDLKSELEDRGPLPIEEAVGYVLQAACGLAEAHSLGIIHRDLKPSNLFLARLRSGRSIVKVLDFGIAKELTADSSIQLTRTYNALGSAPYMSPEQVRAAKSVDERTDVWALGVVLYELLTRQLPFEGDSVTAIAAAIIADHPASVRVVRTDIPPELEGLLLQCLEKDLSKRFDSLASFAAALSQFAGPDGPIYAARVAQALGLTSKPPSMAVRSVAAVSAERSPSHTPTLPSAPKSSNAADNRDVTRSEWASTGGVRTSLTRKQTLLATVSALVGVVGLFAIWIFLSGKKEDPSPAASFPVTPASVKSTAAAPSPDSTVKTSVPSLEPVTVTPEISQKESQKEPAGVTPAPTSTAKAARTKVAPKHAPKPKRTPTPTATADPQKVIDPDSVMRRTL